jgi:site-specific DNA-methyltransferase (adenine-specific)
VSGELERTGPTQLTAIERGRLAQLEQVVDAGLQTFVDVGLALQEIRDGRLYRQSHDTFETYLAERFGISRSRGYRLIDAARVAEVVSPMGDIANERQARELVPLLDDEVALVETWRELRDRYPDQNVTAQRIRRLVVPRLERERRERDAAGRRAAETDLPPLPADVDVRCCDIRDLVVDDESVALIFTDPPYLADTVDEYDALGAFAAGALRPGGMLVAYTGNVHALACMQLLARHLTFVALGGVYMPGSHTLLHHCRMRVTLKPLAFFARGHCKPPNWWTNVLTSPRPDKQHHPWQQSEGDARDLIAALTEPGDLVCDPFLGGGTTAVVCRDLGRRFVGCDVDEVAVATTRRRLAGELERDDPARLPGQITVDEAIAAMNGAA